MARAYFDCHQCGASVAVHARNRRDADRLADWHASQEHRCLDCERAAREADNRAAAQANAAAGLPPLTGTANQIAWAETIRQRTLDTLDRARRGELSRLETIAQIGDIDLSDPILPALLDALRAQTAAAWWIDRRDRKIGLLLDELARTQPIVPLPSNPADTALEAAALAESTVRPPSELTAAVAEIRVIGERIEIVFPEKREDFRQLVRYELGYAWSGTAWGRVIGDRAGPLADRVVEVAHRLLSAGFPIRLQDSDLRARAIAGDYAPERKRWITRLTSGEHQGKLFVAWPRDDDFYDSAKRLPGARYSPPGIAVPASSFDALDDFAEANGFHVSAAARLALDTARAAHDAALVARPARTVQTEPDGPGSMPEATGEIDPALLDD